MALTQLEEQIATLETLKDILDYKQIKNEIVDSVHTYNGEPYRYIQFSFPIARDSDTIRVNDDDNINSIIATNFDKYRGITNYEAIWSSELKK